MAPCKKKRLPNKEKREPVGFGPEVELGSQPPGTWDAACCAPTSVRDGEQLVAEGVAGLGAEEVFEEEAREAAGVVADDGVLLKEVVEEHAEAELLEG
jgi:hypothetical protein